MFKTGGKFCEFRYFTVTGQKIRYKKSCRGIEQVREAGRIKIKPFLSENDSEKILEQSQSAVERGKTKHKIALGKPITIALSRI